MITEQNSSAVMGTVVGLKTMADGTVRLTLDMQCTLSELAGIGAAPGTPYGLARIDQAATQRHAQERAIAESAQEVADSIPHPPKGGPLSVWAARRCMEAEFREFIGANSEEDARRLICEVCAIQSRAELDNNPEAANIFCMTYRIPWQESPLNPYRGKA